MLLPRSIRYVKDEIMGRVRCRACGRLSQRVDGKHLQWARGLCDNCRTNRDTSFLRAFDWTAAARRFHAINREGK